jgi:hypothetical protein
VLDEELREQLADWVRPVTGLPVPDIRVLRRRARRRVLGRTAAAAAITAVAAAAAVGVVSGLPGTGRPAGGRPVTGSRSWSPAPGTWTHGVWQPAGPLPAAGAGPGVAPYIVIPRVPPGTLQVRDVFRSVQVIATVHPLPGQYLDGIAAAGDDRTFVVEATVGGQPDGPVPPINPATVAFDELRLRADGQPEWLHLLFTVRASDVTGGFAISQDASMLAFTTSSGLETVSLATGTGRSWPSIRDWEINPVNLSWAGDQTLAFEWTSNTAPWHEPGRAGLRLLDVTAPGSILQASRLVIGYTRYCTSVAVCRDSALVTPDGSAILVDRTLVAPGSTYHPGSSGNFQQVDYTGSVAEVSTRTGQILALVTSQVTTPFPGPVCVPLWTDPSGEQVVTSCVHPEIYDRGHVGPISVYIPMYGTNVVSFGWGPGYSGSD